MELKDFLVQIYRGKTLGRILFNNCVKSECKTLSGRVLDLAGGSNPSYLKYLPNGISLVSTDIHEGKHKVDMNKSLPFKNDEFDSVLFFNAIYIAEDPIMTLSEIKKVLKKNGTVYLSAPFIAAEMPEPHDFARYTAEQLEVFLLKAGFRDVELKRVGGKFISATNILHDFFLLRTIRMFVYAIAILLDKITMKFQEKYPAPSLYFVMAVK